jgi:hypothetical protein
MVEVKTLSPMNLHRVMPHVLATLVRGDRASSAWCARWPRTGHAPWASLLGLGPVGHYGIGLWCGLSEQCTVVIPLGLFQIECISNFGLN